MGMEPGPEIQAMGQKSGLQVGSPAPNPGYGLGSRPRTPGYGSENRMSGAQIRVMGWKPGPWDGKLSPKSGLSVSKTGLWVRVTGWNPDLGYGLGTRVRVTGWGFETSVVEWGSGLWVGNPVRVDGLEAWAMGWEFGWGYGLESWALLWVGNPAPKTGLWVANPGPKYGLLVGYPEPGYGLEILPINLRTEFWGTKSGLWVGNSAPNPGYGFEIRPRIRVMGGNPCPWVMGWRPCSEIRGIWLDTRIRVMGWKPLPMGLKTEFWGPNPGCGLETRSRIPVMCLKPGHKFRLFVGTFAYGLETSLRNLGYGFKNRILGSKIKGMGSRTEF
ncbi:hypothetical protein QAD02_010404 [Eretmocerus hayati]|uniref:Uncharacterized protein n=1 Tax=Eretmocerus hayati TaxID=131215 RepID=A0ACC2NDN1_9HYME|nr:hypothetical protein QAD02_010404 [Eretmocerus hayati]